MESNRTPAEALEAALSIAFPGMPLGDVANEMGISYQTLNFWLKGTREGRPVHVTPKYAPVLERLTNRKVRCEELCPDVDWGVLRMQAGECCCEQKAAH